MTPAGAGAEISVGSVSKGDQKPWAVQVWVLRNLPQSGWQALVGEPPQSHTWAAPGGTAAQNAPYALADVLACRHLVKQTGIHVPQEELNYVGEDTAGTTDMRSFVVYRPDALHPVGAFPPGSEEVEMLDFRWVRLEELAALAAAKKAPPPGW